MIRMKSFIGILGLLIAVSACETKDQNPAPEIPPYETMMVDLKAFDANKSAEIITPSNYEFTRNQVGVWSTLLGVTLAVPVAAFYHSFSESAEWLGNNQWQWGYNVNVFAATYTARLVATLKSDMVVWEMYILRDGVNGFPEFKWFEGTSMLDGKSGTWTLYHSYQFQEKVLEIEWQKTADEVGYVKYDYVRELDNERKVNKLNGCYMEYGLQDNYFDAYVDMYVFDFIYKWSYINLTTEWSTTQYDGRVKEAVFFNDTEWHCWNNIGEDHSCQ